MSLFGISISFGLGRRPVSGEAPALEESAREATGSPLTHAAYLARGYMPELDGLRAISILGVITAHMHTDIWKWLDGGRGVFVFFVLSGYLITRLCLIEENKKSRVSFRAFYTRRAFRLLPAYYITLAAYCVLILVLGFNPEKRDLLVSSLPYFVLYMSDIPGLLGINGQLQDLPFGHSWSLGVEEKFYLVFPVLIFGVLRAGPRLRLPLTTGLTLFFMASPFYGLGEYAALLYPYSNILLGCLLAMLLHEQRWFDHLKRSGVWWWPTIMLGVFLIVQFGLQPEDDTPIISTAAALVRSVYALAATLLLAAVILSHGWLKSAMSWAPLVFIGRISYGIYLIHRLGLNPVEDFLGAEGGGVAINVLSYILASAVSIAAAYVLYLLIEGPLNRFGHAWSRRIQENSKQKTVGGPQFASG